MAFFTQLFLHPAMAAIGVGLITIPIVIHLINRLQYRKVRFAAMEFLLQSQQRNRKRILLEQLLLLLLRILIVLLLAFIFARLILDPSQLSLLEKNETHHLVIIDDSGSMQDRWGETTAFQEGLTVVKKLVSELAGQEGLQTLTLLTTRQPDRTSSNFNHRQIDVAMVSELEDKLETMQRECGFGQTDWAATFAAIKRTVAADDVQQSVVHLISDFRSREWDKPPTMLSDMKSLEAENTLINLVPAVPAEHENLAVTDISGELQSAAVRVPLQLTAQFTNFGQTAAQDVTVLVLVDGEPIPQAISIPRIEPDETVSESFEVTLTTPGEHAISVQVPPDALASDNVRYLTLNVPDKQRVLIADGSPDFAESIFISDALSADSSITGIDVVTVPPDDLRDQQLSGFTAVYLVNVPSLTPDSVQLLRDYVSAGGGVAWFLGNRIDTSFYRKLASAATASEPDESESASTQLGASLFPVPIGQSPVELRRSEETNPGADLELSEHPLFEFLNAADGLLSYYVNIYRYFPLDLGAGADLPEAVQVIGRTRNQDPLFLESTLGSGRVIVCLTSAGPMEMSADDRWHNWPFDINAPGFTVFHLELVKYLSSRLGTRPQLLIDQPLRIAFNPEVYLPELRIDPPESVGVSSYVIQATTAQTPSGDDQQPAINSVDADSGPQNSADDTDLLFVNFTETQRPGVYSLTRETVARTSQTELFAFNVPDAESELKTVTPTQLRTIYSELENLQVQEFGGLEGLRRNDPGKELRTLLLILLLLALAAEQALAYRLGFHSRGTKTSRRKTAMPDFLNQPAMAPRGRTEATIASGGGTA